MSSIMDLLDDFVLGPLNLIDRVEGLLMGLGYRDMGRQFTIRRLDKGGTHSLNECEGILKEYGVAVYGRTHDATNMYFLVKNRQADWAEYLLTAAGVEIIGPAVNERNAITAGSRSTMPTPWSKKPRR